MVAVYYFLTKKYPSKKIDMVVSGDISERFSSFFGFNLIKKNKDIVKFLKKYDLFIGTDASEYHRFTKSSEIFESSPIKKIFIDHHKTISSDIELVLKNTSATSAAEVVYDLIHKLIKIDQPLAELILLGIIGDTGSFTYIRPDQRRIFRITQDLLKSTPIDIQEFKSRFNHISPQVFLIIQEYFKNSQFLEIKGWPKFQISYLTREYIESSNLDDLIVSEASHIFVDQYIRLIEGYSWGFIIKPKITENVCNMSFRSLPGSVNVRLLAEGMDIGGGHDRASGGQITGPNDSPISAKQTLKQITDWMKKNPPVLI
jgi:phosphoesterase RecJ-like protein